MMDLPSIPPATESKSITTQPERLLAPRPQLRSKPSQDYHGSHDTESEKDLDPGGERESSD
jgi:hypothetical protein